MTCEASRIWVLVLRGREIRKEAEGFWFAMVTEPRLSGPETSYGCQSGWADGVLPLPASQTYEEGLPLEVGISRFWDSVVPVSGRGGEDMVCSSTP